MVESGILANSTLRLTNSFLNSSNSNAFGVWSIELFLLYFYDIQKTWEWVYIKC